EPLPDPGRRAVGRRRARRGPLGLRPGRWGGGYLRQTARLRATPGGGHGAEDVPRLLARPRAAWRRVVERAGDRGAGAGLGDRRQRRTVRPGYGRGGPRGATDRVTGHRDRRPGAL